MTDHDLATSDNGARSNEAERWNVAVAEYEHALTARGYYSADTVAALVKRVRRYAQECGHASPWQATPARIARWLDHLNINIRAVYDYRIGLRTFYRWAVEAGRMDTDPTATLWGRRQELEAAPDWMRPLPAFANYLRAAGQSRATIRQRRYQITTLGRTIGVSDPWLVTEDDLIEWFGTRGWAPPTLKAYRAAVRVFYRWAVQVGHIAHDPSKALPAVKLPPPVPRPADTAEILAALDNADPRVGLLVRMQAELGLRIGEACKVSTADVQQAADGHWLYVLGKGRKARRVPIPADLARTILGRADGYLFPGNIDGHLSPNYAGRLVSSALPPGVTPHKLRHRFATATYAQSRDVLAVQQLLGHASPVTTQAYVAVPTDNLRHLVANAALSARPTVKARRNERTGA